MEDMEGNVFVHQHACPCMFTGPNGQPTGTLRDRMRAAATQRQRALHDIRAERGLARRRQPRVSGAGGSSHHRTQRVPCVSSADAPGESPQDITRYFLNTVDDGIPTYRARNASKTGPHHRPHPYFPWRL
jgi:hypothetical protein